ncbi:MULTISPECIES: DHH family phosphoesterase [Pedobacter]|uniref:Phosphoesterase RecJ domain protein n=1 Tax=Pedobacter heparinus (strain ATCC 13125 / DSM 2366 / CIP 104194 / JCM 7457 / NBRC 12017 / NCIMB 9290 / NRRL B-14731 / HIM 762-3) TaxID=485917 RepID=C6Y0K2_PEDHD|nr:MULTISPECIES: DHH family phosphoesterase [Pedobacter]ACU02763.1 phosphoesterase RecJ domain protein [Pedobacter heparinus DSM 2366]MBB5438081.1 phosphoesterase RecJ-like protein [Pedobacter sp. AK017]
MLSISELKSLLATPQKIVITTHHKPDGDAMGSSLGLYAYLIQKGHHVKLITPTDYPYFLHWLPNNADVLIYTEDQEQSARLVEEAAIIFCLDFNTLSRINELGELVRASNAFKIMIDHHLEPEDFDDYRHWSINACAAAQLVYDFIVNELGDGAMMNKDIATCLYTGIMTDSGSFRFESANAAVYRIAADLIDLGAEHWRIHQLVYDNATENRLRFLGYCLSEKLEVLREFNTAVITVTKEELNRYKIVTGDTEGIVNYALSVNGIKLAAFIIERTDKVKLSLRSTGDFPANEICKKYFNGGGHRNAAGGFSDKNLTDTVQEFKALLSDYKNQLLQ